MELQPKNWLDFQHYKDRKPIWIKLHRDLLNNYEFMMLQDDSKMLAPLLWLLASEYQDGIIMGQPDKIAFRLHISVDRLKTALVELIETEFFRADAEFIDVLTGSDSKSEQVASKMVQNACVETEKRRERDREDRESARDEKSFVDAKEVAEYLSQKILSVNPTYKKINIQSWIKDIEKAIRIDGRTKELLTQCIDWIYSTKDGEFWKSNILSGKKLRDKFDTMSMQASRGKSKSNIGVAMDWLHENDNDSEIADALGIGVLNA